MPFSLKLAPFYYAEIKRKMFSKNDIIFYAISGNVIALIAGLAGASLSVILFLSLLIPPIILIILRIIR